MPNDARPNRPRRHDVPFRLNLEQQRNRARELCRAVQAGDPAAEARLRAAMPNRSGPLPLPGRGLLGAAQFAVARELGLPSWPKLKAHIAAMESARAAAIADRQALDADRQTLHIRCGSDISGSLRDAGLSGEFLEYSDPLCQGPVTADSDPIARRARFLTDAYGGHMDFTVEAATEKLRRAEDRLARARQDERVVLWMEHDSYDQLVLIRCLAQFAAAGAPPVLELVSINAFPGSARFIGLGQLPPEALRLLWPRRQPVTDAQLALGRQAWDALRSPDPTALAAISRTDTAGLRDLGPALRRHLRELPSVRDGLSLTQRLVLEVLAEGGRTIGQVYVALMTEREPLPWLSDLMFLAIVEAMGQAAEPAFVLAPESAALPWPQWPMAITEAGRALLAGTRDWLSLGPPERWIGGVRIRPGEPCWRWDEAADRPVRCRP
jgi:hypothetical protein